MKFNILYLLFPAALGACFWIAHDFQGQSTSSFFGMAETEPQTLNFDHDIAARAVFVKAGDWVEAGDTLAIFSRADLERSEMGSRGEIQQAQVEQTAENSILEKEKQLALAQSRAKRREISAQIQLLRTEDSLRAAFRKNVFSDLPNAENKVSAEKIAALEKEIADWEAQTAEEIRILESKQRAQQAIASAKISRSGTEIEFIRSERGRLLLISPINGYVEAVYFGQNALVPAHRDLIKINPSRPNRITGFLHEGSEVPFSLGQKVTLASHARPQVHCEGTIIGSNPKMTELPLRLRKFIELRTWGREIFIQLPDSNQFFISEKILISL
jgi:multidrug resistance efflux pump